jgi:hypothetical protein
MSGRILILTLLASTLAFAGAGAAVAQGPPASLIPRGPLSTEVGAPVSPQRSFLSSLTVDPPGPYEVEVRTSGSAVALTVYRGRRHKRIAATEYLARGVATPERMQATFGRFGRISMHFRESRHRPWAGKPRRCRGGDSFVARRGIFAGSLRFRGEGGYLDLRIHRAKGSVITRASKCLHRRPSAPRAASSSSPFEDSFSGMVASQRDGVDLTAFLALGLRGKLVYFAQREENRGKLSVVREAFVASHGDFDLNEAITAGKFSPGTPFHGVGRYRAAPDGSTSWLGNLTVDFPGAPHFPLTGAAYETFLEAGL